MRNKKILNSNYLVIGFASIYELTASGGQCSGQ